MFCITWASGRKTVHHFKMNLFWRNQTQICRLWSDEVSHCEWVKHEYGDLLKIKGLQTCPSSVYWIFVPAWNLKLTLRWTNLSNMFEFFWPGSISTTFSEIISLVKALITRCSIYGHGENGGSCQVLFAASFWMLMLLAEAFTRNSYQLTPTALGDILQIPSKVRPQPQQTQKPMDWCSPRNQKQISKSTSPTKDRPSYSLLPSARIKPLWRLPARHESWGRDQNNPSIGWPLEVMKVIFREFIPAVGMTQISEFVWDTS